MDFNFLNLVQVAILFANVVLTLMSALILSIYREFESTSHFIEYSAQILISCVNFLFIIKAKKEKEENTIPEQNFLNFKTFIAFLSTLLSIFNLLVYAKAFNVNMEPERAAHFCEFINESVNACFAMVFAVQLLREVEREMKIIYQNITLFIS